MFIDLSVSLNSLVVFILNKKNVHLQPRATPQRSMRTPRALRRNPERMSRPHTRSRSLIDGPPSPPPEEEPEDKFNLVRKSPYYEEVDEPVSWLRAPVNVCCIHVTIVTILICFSPPPAQPRRRCLPGSKAIPHVVRPVEDITEWELQKICQSVREKVYNTYTVSSPRRQKQLVGETKVTE